MDSSGKHPEVNDEAVGIDQLRDLTGGLKPPPQAKNGLNAAPSNALLKEEMHERLPLSDQTSTGVDQDSIAKKLRELYGGADVVHKSINPA